MREEKPIEEIKVGEKVNYIGMLKGIKLYYDYIHGLRPNLNFCSTQDSQNGKIFKLRNRCKEV